jgi:hypothetical protein
MRLALAALVLTLPAASPAGTPAPAGGVQAPAPICGQDLKLRPARLREAPRSRRLGELPSGGLTLTVVNRVGKCIEPVVVRQGYGALADGKGR